MKNKLNYTLFCFAATLSLTIAQTKFCLAGSPETIKKVGKRNTAGLAKMKQFTEKQGTYLWSFYDATKRASNIMIDSNGKMRVLSETQPDAATEYLMKLGAALKIKAKGKGFAEGEGSGKLDLETATTIARLGERNVTVNMQRDALYRLSELANNHDLKDTTIERLFRAIITQSADIEITAHRADSVKALAEIAKSQAAANLQIAKAVDSLNTALNKTITEKTKSVSDSLQAARKEIADLKKKVDELKPTADKKDEPGKKYKLNIDATLKEEKN
ncbi:MAG: hypothetical protein KIS94_03535 [Chitinophagales bacterium]|nr:hypothetical protein [Chitinophagales bacterium]